MCKRSRNNSVVLREIDLTTAVVNALLSNLWLRLLMTINSSIHLLNTTALSTDFIPEISASSEPEFR